ncbi:hypothetical protein ACF3DV_33430 (plasmid) [Chlorogloeopsis fritschii PCC 9212]|nr:hypothetical protein [Chlorogloeopsis fritschii]
MIKPIAPEALLEAIADLLSQNSLCTGDKNAEMTIRLKGKQP